VRDADARANRVPERGSTHVAHSFPVTPEHLAMEKHRLRIEQLEEHEALRELQGSREEGS
jgi:hypothetical protein